MRLTAVKLAGFKSFVDPTTFRAPTNLTGIVGPNGCGKSNIIDAVRWVMGEGSARVLRGELMSDVIFSGSSTRKPVGTATVELLFDNSDGKVSGEFADYSEISIKRQISRDGISTYFLNGSRCRRKDVRDLFLGTGAGSTGYSIIVQGMISQIVDARPEDIRGHLEEAAGISKYKERRRETERRISHTRDNLDRLSDLREEVENHLNRLKRQAAAAERYKKYKQQQRELKSRLLALQWRHEMQLAEGGRQALATRETAIEEQKAQQRAAEAALEKIHQDQTEAGDAFNDVQGELYAVGGDIARLEQAIKHSRQLQEQQQKEYDEISNSLQDLEQHMLLDKAQVGDLTGKLAEQEPQLQVADKTEVEADNELTQAESEVQEWQDRLETHHQSFNDLSRQADGLRARLEGLDQRMASAVQRLEALDGEGKTVGTLNLVADVEKLKEQSQNAAKTEQAEQDKLNQAKTALSDLTDQLRDASDKERELQSDLMTRRGRLEALQSLQKAGEATRAQEWLESRGLEDHPLLLTRLKPQPGWEQALETVLGHWLEARVVGSMADNAVELNALKEAELTLVSDASGSVRPRSGTLAEKVKAPDAVTAMLNHIRVVDSLDEALEYLDMAGEEESAVTADGEWIGPGWARVSRGESAQAGMLARENEISSLKKETEKLKDSWQKLRSKNEKLRDSIPRHEEEITSLQTVVNNAHREHAQLESKRQGMKSRITDLDRRSEQIGKESAGLKQRQKDDTVEVKEARATLDVLLEKMAGGEQLRSELDAQRRALLERRDLARTAASTARQNRHKLALETSACRASLDSLNQSLERMDSQVGQLQQRYITLSELTAKAKDPEEESREEMSALLEKRVQVETRLGEARARLQQLEEDYRQQDAARQQAVQKNEEQRTELERARLKQQEIELNARNYQRQAESMEADVKELAEGLPDDVEPQQWEEEIERLGVRITRLEPVNLAAIQEYDEELKRKEYLDAQNDDLIQALETLEAAIAKIDRKTRTRFKDTFDAVNKGMQELFPRLFGGGHGYLELTGEDLLTTGVSIMARPPGKRVASIHLMSGGEKALTAVAFIFAIFRLNPAPFCLLDEVDAPLDDANVGRFSDLVKEMSDTVQFIVVTHNKITMEAAYQLSGVTMREPGVSRLVQVDIDEAARMAEA